MPNSGVSENAGNVAIETAQGETAETGFAEAMEAAGIPVVEMTDEPDGGLGGVIDGLTGADRTLSAARPFDGQSWTIDGDPGDQVVEVRLRDVADCVMKAVVDATPTNLYEDCKEYKADKLWSDRFTADQVTTDEIHDFLDNRATGTPSYSVIARNTCVRLQERSIVKQKSHSSTRPASSLYTYDLSDLSGLLVVTFGDNVQLTIAGSDSERAYQLLHEGGKSPLGEYVTIIGAAETYEFYCSETITIPEAQVTTLRGVLALPN